MYFDQGIQKKALLSFNLSLATAKPSAAARDSVYVSLSGSVSECITSIEDAQRIEY